MSRRSSVGRREKSLNSLFELSLDIVIRSGSRKCSCTALRLDMQAGMDGLDVFLSMPLLFSDNDFGQATALSPT